MPQRRAALYARYSTDMQSDRSVEDQHALCEGFALAQGLTVAARYSDRARSGATVQGREGLAALMADARAGRFEVVVIDALDRLSRDQEDLAGLHKRLTFAGIEILAVYDYARTLAQLGTVAWRIDPVADREICDAFRALISRVVLIDTPAGYDVEVVGPLTPLVRRTAAQAAKIMEGRVVAEERIARPSHNPVIPWGRWPVRKSADIRHSSVASAD